MQVHERSESRDSLRFSNDLWLRSLEVEISKTCTLLRRQAHFQFKMYNTPQRRTTFGSSDVENVHAVVAPSTFPSQKCKKLTGSDHYLTFRCGKVYAVVARSTFPSHKCKKLTGSDHSVTFRCRKKCTLTNYLPTSQTNLTNLTTYLNYLN